MITSTSEQFNIVDEFGNKLVDEFGNYIVYTLSVNTGRLGFWYQVENVSSVTIHIGSNSSNYVSETFTPEAGWVYYDVKVSDMVKT